MANLFNDNVAKGRWQQMKGEIQKAWGRLTDDELNQTEGDLTRLGGLIQQKYGLTQDEVRRRIDELVRGSNSNNKEDFHKF